MTHLPQLSSSASRTDCREMSFGHSLESQHSCCAQARDAARWGRYSIAHELFQEALIFFDRAHGIIWDDTDDLYFWQRSHQLSRARGELDGCAALIYTAEVALESCAWPALAEGNLE